MHFFQILILSIGLFACRNIASPLSSRDADDLVQTVYRFSNDTVSHPPITDLETP